MSHYQYVDDLVRKAKSGDANAIEQLMTYYDPLVQACVIRCIRRDNRLKNYRDDVKSEAYLVMHTLVQAYDPELSFFSYYLRNTFEYALFNSCRKQLFGNASAPITEIPFEIFPPDWEPIAPDDPFLLIEYQQAVKDALGKLKPAQREAIILYFFEDLTQEQASEKLNITQASFSKRLSRALNALRAELAQDF